MPNYTYSDALGSAVKNKLGATTHDELEKRETKYVIARGVELAVGLGPSRTFDAAHLKAIHRHLFQDVYEWAGRTRDEPVKLSDGSIATEPVLRKLDGKPFMPGPQIAEALKRVGDVLRDADYLRGLPREAFAARAADVMTDINTAHPFREGNGRTQRAFLAELAAVAGHELDFSVVSRERMIQVSIAASHGNREMMRRMFEEITHPQRRAALSAAIAFFSRQGFAWNDQYLSTAEPGWAIRVTMAGTAGEHFMARTDSSIVIGQSADLPARLPARGEDFALEPRPWPEPRIARSIEP